MTFMLMVNGECIQTSDQYIFMLSWTLQLTLLAPPLEQCQILEHRAAVCTPSLSSHYSTFSGLQ